MQTGLREITISPDEITHKDGAKRPKQAGFLQLTPDNGKHLFTLLVISSAGMVISSGAIC